MQAFKVLIVTFVVGCSSSDTTNPPVDASTPDTAAAVPGITISSPAAGAMVTAGTDAMKSVPITFALTNFTLKAAGTCGTTASCGHIHVLVDGAACTPASAPYNNEAHDATMPAMALLASCPTALGAHTATLELHNDDHSPVKGSSGSVIAAQVAFTAK